jgi:hypothetical protein
MSMDPGDKERRGVARLHNVSEHEEGLAVERDDRGGYRQGKKYGDNHDSTAAVRR